MPYQIADGWDNADELEPLVPQPKSPGIIAPRRRKAGDRVIYEDGFKSTTWEFTALTEEQMSAILTAAGLSDTVASAKVTISTPVNSDREFENFNAVIETPRNINFAMGFYKNVVFSITSLEALS